MMALTEAADRLGVQAGTLRVQIAKGKLKAKKMGRDWFVTEREVERYRRDVAARHTRDTNASTRSTRGFKA